MFPKAGTVHAMTGRVLVGRHRMGHTYWYDRGDRFVYSLKPDGESWGGYLCAGDVWERTFNRSFALPGGETLPV